MSPSLPPMRFERALGELVAEIPGARLVSGDAQIPITGVRHDSRAVQPGDLFVARGGRSADGEHFIADALARGARAVLLRQGSPTSTSGAARLEAPDVPRALAFAAEALCGRPTHALEVVGITGTNGKTTTAHLVQACVDGCGGRAGIVGTLGYRFGDLNLLASHTSPEADELARVAAAMRARGATHLAMEVSSIALAAARVDAVRFRVAAFTNLTQDHLDYHGSMEAYGAAKARLFLDLSPGAAAINVGDPFGAELARRVALAGGRTELVTFTAELGAAADVAPEDLSLGASGIAMKVRTPKAPVIVRSPLVGAHNVANLLTALAIGLGLGFEPEALGAALSVPVAVPGRLERCDTVGVDDITVLVDYAHTPDALARVLASVRPMTQGRILCVFGCGGDRDPMKRPAMGEAAGRGADLAIVTNDNPRSEDPQAIADAIVPGLTKTETPFTVELDRARAIEAAVREARPGDLVLIAGKGHEPYQILGSRTIAFDDREEARRALALRRAAGDRG